MPSSFRPVHVVPSGQHRPPAWWRPPAPPRKRKARPHRKRARPAPPPTPPATIPPPALKVLLDRLEAAIEADRLELVEEPADVPLARGPAVDTASLAAVLAVLFPEEYRGGEGDPEATGTPKGSAARIAVYRLRAAARRKVTLGREHAENGDGGRKGAKVEMRRNGQGVRVLGWEDETARAEPQTWQEVLLDEQRAALAARRAK